MYDFHMHSRVSYDAESDPMEMALAAKAADLREICFTDHIDYCLGACHEDISFTPGQYRNAYRKIKIPGLVIRQGVELGLTVWNKKEATEDAAAIPYDFIIGSIHHVDNIDIYLPEFWRDKTPREAERRYLETMLECVKIHDAFDVLGHLTYVSKSPCNPVPRIIPLDDYREIVEEILDTLVRKGKGLEINTSGLDRIGDFFPGREYLRRFRELGGEIVTVGSDAHTLNRVGRQIPEALDVLKEIFGYVCTFEGRKPVFHRL